MKGKLVKCNHFYALQIDSDIIAVSLDKETESHIVNYKHSLSKQNCDEIFWGLYDKEIEVEVIMDRIPADLAPDGWDVFPKLDAEGCIILKRVE